MIAGAICEGNSCNSLVLFIFGVLAAIAIVTIVVSVALMATVSAVQTVPVGTGSVEPVLDGIADEIAAP